MTFACIASFICGIGLGLYLAPRPKRNRRGQFVKQDGSYKPKHMRVVIVLLASLTAAAQTVKPPTYTTEPVTHQAAHCEAGWHLEQWHYGADDARVFTNAVYRSDPSGYRASVDLPKADPHPDRCVKDGPKK